MFSIKYKLFLTLLLAIGSVVFLSFFVLRVSFDQNFLDYVNEKNQRRLSELTQPLEGFYQQHQSWAILEKSPWMFHQLLRKALFTHLETDKNLAHSQIPDEPNFGITSKPLVPALAMTPQGMLLDVPDEGRISPMALAKSHKPFPVHLLRYALLDKDEKVLLGPNDINLHLPHVALFDGDKVVGYLLKLPEKSVSELNNKYIQQQDEIFRLAAIAVLVIALLLTIPITFHLMKPITQLTQGTRQLIRGQYETQITPYGKDELAVLSKHFNTLAETLKSNESSRKRWIADISHELRTPLAILKAEIEGMEDGVIELNMSSLHSLANEVTHLTALVDDLFELTLSDLGALSYHKEPCVLTDVLKETVACFQSQFTRKGLELELNIEAEMQEELLLLDKKRIKQLLENLIKNSYSYTQEGGKLVVSLTKKDCCSVLSFNDTKPNVMDDSLGSLFDPLYREDCARGRSKGGAGLGLSIVKNIVNAHQGQIKASHSTLGGLEIQVRLPILQG